MTPSALNKIQKRTTDCIELWQAGDRTLGSLSMLITDAITAAVEEEREACAVLHSNIDPRCSHEAEHGDPGGGAMGAVIRYRDAIRARQALA